MPELNLGGQIQQSFEGKGNEEMVITFFTLALKKSLLFTKWIIRQS